MKKKSNKKKVKFRAKLKGTKIKSARTFKGT